MSDKKPTRRDLNQLINVCCGAHDLVCYCNEPVKHIILHCFSNQEPYFVTKEEKDNIIKCLITTEEDKQDTGPDDGFGPGDLEALFAIESGAGEDDTG